MFALSLALIAQEFEGRERGKALGIWGATTGAAVAVGPLVGGVLVEHLGWEWIFFVNLPVGAARCSCSSPACARRATRARGASTGAGGDRLLRCAVHAGVRPGARQRGGLGHPRRSCSCWRRRSRSWPPSCSIEHRSASPDVRAVAVSQAGLHRRAMWPPSRSRRRCSRCSSTSRSMCRTCSGYSPLESGLIFLPVTVLSFFAAALSGNLTSRVPARVLLAIGLGLVGLGLALDARRGGGRRLDHAACRLRPGRGRHRPDQPGHRLVRHRGGARRPAAAWRLASTPPSARWASPPASPRLGRSSSPASRAAWPISLSRIPERALGGLSEAVSILGPKAAAAAPAGQREAVAEAASSAFVGGLNDILLLASIIAFAGAVLALVLVRQSDFVAAPDGAAPAG